jgi:hemoglobin-like flavoprotein
MGSGGLSAKQMRGSEKEIIVLMMPVYYSEFLFHLFPCVDIFLSAHNAVVSDRELSLAKASWNLIIEDKSPAYVQQKASNPNFDHASCISWFYSVFYDRLFDVHPMCRPLFTTGIVSQGKFLVKMVSMTLSCITKKEKFTKTMEDLAMRHCERGIRGVEYGIVGDVLFYCIKKSCGDTFTLEQENAWKLIYSSMLQIIVPLCVEYERTGVVHRTVERVTDSANNSNHIDSATKASQEADAKMKEREQSKDRENGSAKN